MDKKIGLSFLEEPEEQGKKYQEGRRRYLPAEEKLSMVKEVARGRMKSEVARQHGVHPYTVTGWVKKLQGAGAKTEQEALKVLEPRPPVRKTPVPGISEDVKEKIVALKKQHFEMGPAQIRAQLKRFHGVRVSIKPIRRVLREAGYDLEARRKADFSKSSTRFEMSRPNELWTSDIFEFRVHKEKGYLVSFLDDHSRYILGWRVGTSCTGQDVIELLDETIARHGKPERILTDRGPQYASFEGMTAFQKHLEELEIDHSMARSYHPQTCGKLEAFHRSLSFELLDMREFESLEEARKAISGYISHYNTARAHMGIGGLTPADRYFGRQEEVLKEMSRRCSERKGAQADGEDSKESLRESGAIELLQLVLQDSRLILSFCGKEFQIG